LVALIFSTGPGFGQPQQRQFQGGFRPLASVRFRDDDSGDLANRRQQRQQGQLPPPRRRRPEPDQLSRRPPPPPPPRRRPLEPVQPVRDIRPQAAPRRPESAGARPESPASGPRRPLPATEASRSASHLFVRPEFDVFGNPITFKIIVPENEELPDFRKRPGTKRPRITRPKTNLGPDLRPRLPVFGQPDAILQATEELRSRDLNHESIVPLGPVNAGVLPLAGPSDDANDLGLFPPFAPAQQ